jgi:hypothetical protein
VRRGRALVIVAVVLVLGGALGAGALLLHQRHDSHASVTTSAARKPDGVPSGAQATVGLLLSAEGRAALTPELRAALPHGNRRLFPAGSKFTPSKGGWQQAGAYANLTGTLREPGKAPVKAEIGFVDRHGKWLVTFEGTL